MERCQIKLCQRKTNGASQTKRESQSEARQTHELEAESFVFAPGFESKSPFESGESSPKARSQRKRTNFSFAEAK